MAQLELTMFSNQETRGYTNRSISDKKTLEKLKMKSDFDLYYVVGIRGDEFSILVLGCTFKNKPKIS